MDRIKKTTSTASMPDGFSWPATAAVCKAKRPGWLPFLSIGQGFMQVGNRSSVCPKPLLIENMLMKLITKADSYSSAGTEAGICN
jgi:hypothetical protein